ncbi:Hint domain-containing protein [uncultured Tateyamaria sp.]|uniref:Hint domain-containing protein n=1 Tax=uncultured Tateyamaria sp. TaxID=455651 RepID=UPI00262BE29F|nr:Hint domain-containing protein [uncultured Tateyamaria sp.]
MATYTVTTSNWNNASFWSSISQSGPGHTLDFSALPSNFSVDFWPDASRIVISDGTSSFVIGDSDYGGSADATMGGSTQLEYFTNVRGSQGDDYTDGGGNNDTIYGNSGNDTLTGHEGNDSIEGGDGNDEIYGGQGSDDINAGDGNDTVSGGSDNDTINGDAGGDSIFGDTGEDRVSGGAGSDRVYGGDGNDTVSGEQGRDSLYGGAGHDSMFASGGGIPDDGVGDYYDGGTGNDTIDAGSGDDTILGGDGEDSISGNGGNDSIQGGAGTDTIRGGDGNDTIDGGLNSDTIYGGSGDDYIFDSGASLSDDTIYGEGGNDTIVGGVREDYLDGGDDADTFIIEDGFGNDTIVGGEGGTDDDTIDLSALSGPVTVDFASDEAGSITDGADTITFSEIENVTLTEQSDVYDARAATTGQTIDGAGGDDTIYGSQGGDTIDGGAGDDRLEGGTGDDLLTGGTGSDTFVYTPGDGDDTITDFNTGNTGTLDDGDTTNNDFIDLSGYYDHISELYADQADDGILNQSNTTDTRGQTTDYSDNDQFGSGSLTFQGASADNSSFTQENTGVVCFTSGTAILTPRGDVLIDDLRVGDLVITADNGPQPIRWIGTRQLDHETLAGAPNLKPILINADVLGNTRPLLVSPQHCMLVGQDRLVRAKHLALEMPGVRVAHGKRAVRYIHLMFDAHQIIFAESAPSESFYPGPMSLRMMRQEDCQELAALFPDLPSAPDSLYDITSRYGDTVRTIVAKRAVPDLLNVLHAS